MGKVSIGLRGWRFDEADVFTDDGDLRPLEEMPDDVATRVSRLSALVGSPCDACWLVHGDEELEHSDPAAVVYGEPLEEVVLCRDHEVDFVYWFREAGGSALRGDPAFQEAFHEWFADGGRAPDGFEGIEHVETAPDDLPRQRQPDLSALNVEVPEHRRERIDLREMAVYTGAEAERVRQSRGDDAGTDHEGDDDVSNDDAGEDELDLEGTDVDLSREYPS